MQTTLLSNKQPVWGIVLGLLPAAHFIVLGFLGTLLWPKQFDLPQIEQWIFVLVMMGIYIGVSMYQKQVPLWTLPGLGMIIPGILISMFTITQPPQSGPPTPAEQFINSMISIEMLLVFVALGIWGTRLARRHGNSVAIILILPSLLTANLSIMDPTYAWFLYWPDAQIWAALTETTIYAIPLLIMPIVVFQQNQSSQINKWVIGLSLLMLELSVAAGIVRTVGVIKRGVANAPTLFEDIWHMLTVNQIMIAFMLAPLVGLLLFYTHQGCLGSHGAQPQFSTDPS